MLINSKTPEIEAANSAIPGPLDQTCGEYEPGIILLCDFKRGLALYATPKPACCRVGCKYWNKAEPVSFESVCFDTTGENYG